MLDYLVLIFLYSVNWLLVKFFSSPPSFLSAKDRNVLLSYYVALTHSFLAISLASFSHYSTSGVSYSAKDTLLQQLTIKNTIAYLTYDIILGFVQKALDLKMIVHHFFGIVGGLAILQEGNAGSAALVALLLTEITSPLFQLKNILRLKKNDEGVVAQVNEALFAVGFVVCRPVLVWILLYNMICAGFHWAIILNSSIIYAVGLVWSYTIVCIIRLKALKSKPTAFEKLRDSKFKSLTILAWITFALPYIIGQKLDWNFIHLRYGNFTFI